MQTDHAGTVARDLPRPSPPQPSQTELIRSIAQGDKSAMQVLFAQHRLRVYRFALRLVEDKDTADDLVSEVFLEVWRHARRFEGRCRISTWLLAITRNLSLSMLRRRQMERLDDRAAASIPDRADDPEAAIQKQQQSAILAQCLTKLTPAHREVIDLVYYHGCSINEVAAIIRVAPSTVKTRIFYARNRIAKLLSGFEWADRFDAALLRRQRAHCQFQAPRFVVRSSAVCGLTSPIPTLLPDCLGRK